MLQEKKNKDGLVIWKIDKQKKLYEYCFDTKGTEFIVIKKLIYKGYTKKPTSMNENGYGFSRAMKPFYFQIKDTFGVIECITIENNEKSKIAKKNGKYFIVINKEEYEGTSKN